jgi:hypothetical protein
MTRSVVAAAQFVHTHGEDIDLPDDWPNRSALDNGARWALIPSENQRNFLEVSRDIEERVNPVFFSDPMTAAIKGLGISLRAIEG